MPEASAHLDGAVDHTLRLNGDTFHQFMSDYRNMPRVDRLNALAQLQLRIAAIYAVQNEDAQRQETQDSQHRALDVSRTTLSARRHHAPRRHLDESPQQPTNHLSGTDLSLTQDVIHTSPNHAPNALM
jgi:hypothetical protein